jgi:uncharacterized protein YjiS (DUF1127 family)
MSCGSTISPSTQSWKELERTPTRVSSLHVPSPFGWISALIRMEARWRQRQTLLELDDHLLSDIGITRQQAEREVRKPFGR